jgi:hypothetical protein
MSPHDATTIPRQAPRSAADCPQSTSRAIGIASNAGMNNDRTPRQRPRHTRHEVADDDHVEAERPGDAWLMAMASFSCVSVSTWRDTTRASRMRGTDANPLKDSNVARRNSA